MLRRRQPQRPAVPAGAAPRPGPLDPANPAPADPANAANNAANDAANADPAAPPAAPPTLLGLMVEVSLRFITSLFPQRQPQEAQ